ncbi:MAG: murein L,D-transpeptidase catalytic domain family protein [Chitinophagaceae bacterium]
MKKKFRAFYLLVSSVIIGILHLPFAFAKSATGTRIFMQPENNNPARTTTDSLSFLPAIRSVYDSLHLGFRGLSREAFEYARKGFEKLLAEGRLLNDSIISILDFSRPSSEKRLFILDMKNYRLLFNTLVSHGRNSGREYATSFSNQASSYMSSPGFYITRETYEGKNGYSLKLEGIEKGINDNAYERGIVVHGAGYVNESLAHAQGYIGRSQGCPAVPVEMSQSVINRIRNGSCLFIYHPSYVHQSVVL